MVEKSRDTINVNGKGTKKGIGERTVSDVNQIMGNKPFSAQVDHLLSKQDEVRGQAAAGESR